MSVTPCMCCDKDYAESVDAYCDTCGDDCLDAHTCKSCIEKHNLEFQRNEQWQKMTDEARENAIRQAT